MARTGRGTPALFSGRPDDRPCIETLRNLGLDALDVVNLRIMFDVHGPAEGSIEAPLAALAKLQRQGLVRHIGLSNVTRASRSRKGVPLADYRLRAEPIQPGAPSMMMR